MVKSNQPSPVWPYLGILVCLFAIAVTAPRGWQSLASNESIQRFLDRHPAETSSQPSDASQPAAAATAPAAQADDAASPAERPRESSRHAPTIAVSLPQPREEVDDDSAQTDSSPVDATSDPSPASPPVASEPAASEPAASESVAEQPGVAEPEAEQPSGPERPAGWLCVPRPEQLIAELAALSSHPQSAAWAEAARQSLDQLCQINLAARSADGTRPAGVILAALRQIALRGESLAKAMEDPASEAQLMRAQYAILRRVDVWDAASRLPAAPAAVFDDPAAEQALAAAVARVEQYVATRPNAGPWRDYLLLDRLVELTDRRNAAPPMAYFSIRPAPPIPSSADVDKADASSERRELARELLDRLSPGRLVRDQRRYVEAAPLVQLKARLNRWIAAPVDPQTLLDDLERYEASADATDGGRLAEDCRNLVWSADPAAQHLGSRVEEHYRNANIRLAVAGTFLNRLIPQPGPRSSQLRDTIVGADVTGLSTTRTRLEVILVPDANRLRIGIEAHGVVHSNTTAASGPAVFYNAGESTFVVRKLFLCDAKAVTVFRSQAEAAATRSDLLSVETSYDGVPLVGTMARGIALSQHDELQDQARWETEQKVAARAQAELDAEIAAAVEKMNTRVRDQLWDTLARLDLELQPLALSTSEDRAVMRLRLAGGEQLSAYTPRPRAPSDSLMSLQVHESALNNVLEKLDLNGRTFTLSELFTHLREKLNRPPVSEADADLPEDIVVTFAATDAVRVRCRDGRVQVRIALAELRDGKRRWHDFAVVTHYRPDSSTLDIHFVRDGTIFLEGESLRGKPQITLRTIFSKVLSAQRGWGLVAPEVAADPRLEDVTISQFTVDQGWIGLAYAPRPSVARKPREEPIGKRPGLCRFFAARGEKWDGPFLSGVFQAAQNPSRGRLLQRCRACFSPASISSSISVLAASWSGSARNWSIGRHRPRPMAPPRSRPSGPGPRPATIAPAGQRDAGPCRPRCRPTGPSAGGSSCSS